MSGVEVVFATALWSISRILTTHVFEATQQSIEERLIKIVSESALNFVKNSEEPDVVLCPSSAITL